MRLFLISAFKKKIFSGISSVQNSDQFRFFFYYFSQLALILIYPDIFTLFR